MVASGVAPYFTVLLFSVLLIIPVSGVQTDGAPLYGGNKLNDLLAFSQQGMDIQDNLSDECRTCEKNSVQEDIIPTELPVKDLDKEIDNAKAIIEAYGLSWTAGRTSVSDRTPAEYERLLGVRRPLGGSSIVVSNIKPGTSISTESIPTSFDWRNNNGDWTTPVKDQGDCGSCWAFAVTGVFESFWERLSGNSGLNPDFSEQYLVSCDSDAYGCGGGNNEAMGYFVSDAGRSGGVGTVKESDFPYTASNAACRPFAVTRYKVPDGGGWYYLAGEIELAPVEDLKRCIMATGPVSAYIFASPLFQYYTGGIFEDPTVNPAPGKTNHAVVIVGWGNDPVKGKDYWIVKNSWGPGWGEAGWFRIYTDQCRIGEGAAYFTANPEESAPVITGISPVSAKVGGNDFTLTVMGRNFAPGSRVEWNGIWRPTTQIVTNQIDATIYSDDIAQPGVATITVRNPDGVRSDGVSFTIGSGGSSTPSIIALEPANAVSGGSAFTLNVKGTNFVSGSVVRWNGADRTTTFRSAGEIVASIPALDISAPGTAQVSVINPDGSVSSGVVFTVTSQPISKPVVTLLNPSNIVAGGSGFTLAVEGKNFVKGCMVRWNGIDRSTTYVSSSKVTAAITAGDIATPGTMTITIANPDDAVSNGVVFTITSQPISKPVVTSLTPMSIAAGAPAFTLTVKGKGFVNGCMVRWNGSSKPTTFGSSSRVTAAITAGDIVSPGTVTVTIVNPDGGVSNALTIVVTSGGNALPVITQLKPSRAVAGTSVSLVLTIIGENFIPDRTVCGTPEGQVLGGSIGEVIPGSRVSWDGILKDTKFVSSGELKATISASDLASPSDVAVAVVNPAPGGGTSGAVIFTIVSADKPITLSGIDPSHVKAGGDAFSLTVKGDSFTKESTVRWNGNARSTTYFSGTELHAAIPASDLVRAGTAKVTVTSPGGKVSAPVVFTVDPPQVKPPFISLLSPSWTLARGPAFTLELGGKNFVKESRVLFGGTAQKTTYYSPGRLTAVIPASDIVKAGSVLVTVKNPVTDGGISKGVWFMVRPRV